MSKILYRYDSCFRGEEFHNTVNFYLSKYQVIRETDKCYVIKNDFISSKSSKKEIFILKSSDGKRFAYDTKEAAYEGFMHRCLRRELITARQYQAAKEVLRKAQSNKEYLLSLT